jgi:hypothetical protein
LVLGILLTHASAAIPLFEKLQYLTFSCSYCDKGTGTTILVQKARHLWRSTVFQVNIEKPVSLVSGVKQKGDGAGKTDPAPSR